ncbi:MAG: cell division protease FtsH [Myxococcota bacterium]|jgi:cell division protease FtsH
MNRWWAPLLAIVMFVSLLFMVTNMAITMGGETVTWSELKGRIESGDIEQVVFEGDLVRATVRSEESSKEVLTLVAVRADETFIPLLEANEVPYRAVRANCQNGSIGFLLIPLVALGVVWMLLSRQGGPTRGAAAFGRSSASLVPEEGTGVTFADVAGVEEAAEELQEVIAFLTTPEKFTALGGRPPKGVLLVGPPGTGKTLLARAVAGEAAVPFFSISGSSFVEMFVGVGAARVRDLFKTATEHAPCIIFIDELDAVGKARGLSGPAGNEEREQTLNQLLVELDGFDNRKGIIVMAATNRPETLDRALLRAGRFDRQVVVDRPDVRGREAVLVIHARKLKLDPNVDLGEIARMTPGFAGADLANALNEAALLAARRDRDAVVLKDIQDAIERTVAGLEKKNRRLSPKEKSVVSYHECGHAICAAASPGADPVQKISIIPRGIAALGYTIQMPLEDRYLMTKGELLNRITVLYGGRVAEAIVFGDITTGAHDDIRKATDLARRMVVEYGMSKRVGPLNYAPESQANPFGMNPSNSSYTAASASTAEAIESEVRRVIDGCYQRAHAILLDNRELLEEMAEFLLEHEVLDGEKMKSYLDRAHQAAPLAEPPTVEVDAS